MNASRMIEIFGQIARERRRQDEKFGAHRDLPSIDPTLLCAIASDASQSGGLSVSLRGDIVAAFYGLPGEVIAKQMCESRPKTWASITVEELAEAVACFEDEELMREELIQTAASVVAWIEAIDRRLSQKEQSQ